MPDTVYIHYGTDNFIPHISPIRNIPDFPKPDGGLWASREDDPLGWKNFCETDGYRKSSLKYSFRFRLKPGTRILTLSDQKQIETLPLLKPWTPIDRSEMYSLPKGAIPTVEQLNRWFHPNPCYIDYEKISKEYDALELTDFIEFKEALPAWDCNCIVVFRPEVVDLV